MEENLAILWMESIHEHAQLIVFWVNGQPGVNVQMEYKVGNEISYKYPNLPENLATLRNTKNLNHARLNVSGVRGSHSVLVLRMVLDTGTEKLPNNPKNLGQSANLWMLCKPSSAQCHASGINGVIGQNVLMMEREDVPGIFLKKPKMEACHAKNRLKK